MKNCLKGVPFIVFTVLLLAAAVASASAESSSFDILSEYEKLVLDNNQELAELREQLGDLEDTQAEVFILSESGITINGGYVYNPLGVGDAHNFSGTALVSIPVLPQISLNLQAVSTGDASLSLTFMPIAALGADLALEQQIAAAKLSVSHKEIELRWEGRILLVQYGALKNNLEISSDAADLEREKYESAERQFTAGYLSSSQLRSAADDFAGASVGLINAAEQKASAEKGLYQLCGASDISDSIMSFEIAGTGMLEIVDSAYDMYRELFEIREITSQSLQYLQIQRSFLEKQIESTWAIEPGLSLSLSGSLSSSMDTLAGTAGANVSLQLSAESFHFDEIRELKSQIENLDRILSLSKFLLTIDERNRIGALRSAQLSAEISLRYLDTMTEALAHGASELERANISEYEFQEIRNNQRFSESSYLSSLITVYTKLVDLRQLYTHVD
jgi:hypothetical protein